jgi:hypothetical protein
MSHGEPTHINHPVFGEIVWELPRECWFLQVPIPAGGIVDVSIKPHDQDPLLILDIAAETFQGVLRDERRILRDAIREELLELYNGTWCRAGHKLTEPELMEQLRFEYLEINPGWVVPVILSYAAGDLFAGHSVDVEVDEQLQFSDINLIG